MSIPIVEFQKEDFLVTTDPARLDVIAVEGFLANSYWASTRPKEVIEKSLQYSLCFSLFHRERQIGLARVVTDYATFAYFCDVYIAESYRGQGLGHWLIECVFKHPDLQNLRRMLLATRDAHEFYRQFGFDGLANPGRFMEIVRG